MHHPCPYSRNAHGGPLEALQAPHRARALALRSLLTIPFRITTPWVSGCCDRAVFLSQRSNDHPLHSCCEWKRWAGASRRSSSELVAAELPGSVVCCMQCFYLAGGGGASPSPPATASSCTAMTNCLSCPNLVSVEVGVDSEYNACKGHICPAQPQCTWWTTAISPSLFVGTCSVSTSVSPSVAYSFAAGELFRSES